MRNCRMIRVFHGRNSLKIPWVFTRLLAAVFVQLILFSGGGLLVAQEAAKTVTGAVTLAGSGEPAPGANILIKGTQVGTISDVEGRYSIRVSEGDELVVSFIGYLKEEITIGKEDIYNVSLIEDITQLDAVVKVGYGTMKRSDLTGAVVSVSSEDIKASSATSLDQALQGRAAGVLVVVCLFRSGA